MSAAILVASLFAAGAAEAEPDLSFSSTGQGSVEDDTGPSLAELEARSYADDYDVSVDEAVRRLERAVELDDVLNSVVKAEGARVAGFGIVHEPEFGAWVYLVGDDRPSSDTASIQRRSGDLIVQTGANHSLDELVSAMSDREIFEAIPEAMRDRIAYRDIDVEANVLVIAIDKNIPPSESATPDGIAELPLPEAASALENLLEKTAAIDVEVVVDAGSTPQAIYGGEHIRNSGGNRCTSAFAVLSGSTRGMLSAGHCGTITLHRRSRTSAQTGSSYTATTQGSVYGDDGDSLWYTTTQWESDNFYVSTTSTRDATGYESRGNMQGDYVCHFGTSSGYSCGTVVSTNHDPSYAACGWWAGCDNRWVKVEGPSLEACGGDSGGPWFNYRTAYGVHSGGQNTGTCTASGTTYATFTAMNDVLSVLGVTFATS